MIPQADKPPALSSRLRLCFANSAHGTIIKDRFHEGLFHLSKHYSEDGYVMLQLVNPTAGIFSNDKMMSSISLEPDAKAVIASPSSTQLYTMPNDGEAFAEQNFKIEDGACLEFTPQWLVPHKDSLFRQKTKIELSKDANIFYAELLSPGRLAFGESMLFDKLNLEFELYKNKQLVVREHLHIESEAEQALWQIPQWESTYWANLWIAGPDLPEKQEELDEINRQFSGRDDIIVGASRVHENINSIRIAAASTVTVKKAINDIRKEFLKYLPIIKHNRINI